MSDEPYDPATRPPGDIPGGERVRFEREGEHEQFLGGGGAMDIEQSILNSTERNMQVIGWVIIGVTDVVGAMGSGTLQSMTFLLQHSDGRSRQLKIEGIGLTTQVID